MKQPKSTQPSGIGYLQELEAKEQKQSRVRMWRTGIVLSLVGVGGIVAMSSYRFPISSPTQQEEQVAPSVFASSSPVQFPDPLVPYGDLTLLHADSLQPFSLLNANLNFYEVDTINILGEEPEPENDPPQPEPSLGSTYQRIGPNRSPSNATASYGSI